MRHIPGALLRGPDRGRRDVAGQQAVAAPGEHLGQHADGAAGLEGAAVPPRRELGQADRVLAPLIPAVLESPRVRGGLVHRVEVARPQRAGSHRSAHRSSTSCALVKCATIPGGSTGSSRGPAAGQLAGEGLDGRTLPGCDAGGQRYPARTRPGDTRVSRLGPVPHPDRVAQHGPAVRRARPARRAARGLVIGVRVLVPRREADVETGAQLAQQAAELVLVSGDRGVGEPQPDHFGLLGTQQAQRSRRLRGPGQRDHGRIGIRMRGLPVGDRDQPQPRSGRGQDGHRPADAEYLIVGMRRDHGDARPGRRVGHRQLPQLRPRGPRLLPGAGRVDAVDDAPGHHVAPWLATRLPSWARSRSAWCWRR